MTCSNLGGRYKSLEHKTLADEHFQIYTCIFILVFLSFSLVLFSRPSQVAKTLSLLSFSLLWQGGKVAAMHQAYWCWLGKYFKWAICHLPKDSKSTAVCRLSLCNPPHVACSFPPQGWTSCQGVPFLLILDHHTRSKAYTLLRDCILEAAKKLPLYKAALFFEARRWQVRSRDGYH